MYLFCYVDIYVCITLLLNSLNSSHKVLLLVVGGGGGGEGWFWKKGTKFQLFNMDNNKSIELHFEF